MQVLAGTSDGIYEAGGSDTADSVQRLQCGSVREIVRIRSTLFAGSVGGLHVSHDDGQTWSSAGLENLAVWQIRELDNNRILVGTQPAGLYVASLDTLEWEPVDTFANAPEAKDWCVPVEPPMPAAARAVVVDNTNPNRICAGVEVGGIMRSGDGGETWQLVLPGDNPDLHMLFQHPAKSDTLFASTGYGRLDGVAPMVEGNAGVFYSNDFGQSWEYRWRGIEPRYSRPMCIDPRAPHALTVASAPTAFSSYKDEGGAGAMLFRSDDEGLSWRPLTDASRTPSKANFHGLTIDPEREGGVIVGTDTGEVWRVSPTAEWTPVATALRAVRALCAW